MYFYMCLLVNLCGLCVCAASFVVRHDMTQDFEQRRKKSSIKCYARTNFPVRPTFTGRWDLRPFVSLIRGYSMDSKIYRPAEERRKIFIQMAAKLNANSSRRQSHKYKSCHLIYRPLAANNDPQKMLHVWLRKYILS